MGAATNMLILFICLAFVFFIGGVDRGPSSPFNNLNKSFVPLQNSFTSASNSSGGLITTGQTLINTGIDVTAATVTGLWSIVTLPYSLFSSLGLPDQWVLFLIMVFGFPGLLYIAAFWLGRGEP